jgi:hypothetical protein
MSETISHTPVPEPVLAPNQFEISVPRNLKGERIGTGAILEYRQPGRSSGRLSNELVRALFHAVSPTQSLDRLAEQAERRTGKGYITDQERVQFTSQANQEALVQADREQTQMKLDVTRSALQHEVAEQKVKEQEQETETIVIRSLDGSQVIGSFTAPKNATRAELNRAARAAGLDYRISPFMSSMNAVGTRGKGMWLVLKHAFQSITPPEAHQPGEKAA